MNQPTQQRLGTLLPDNRRKVVQKSSKLPFPSQAQSARGRSAFKGWAKMLPLSPLALGPLQSVVALAVPSTALGT